MKATAFSLVIAVNYEHHLVFLFNIGYRHLRTIIYWWTLLEINFGIFSQCDLQRDIIFSSIKVLIVSNYFVELFSREHLLRNQSPVYPLYFIKDQ